MPGEAPPLQSEPETLPFRQNKGYQDRRRREFTKVTINITDIPVFILCGGLGTRLKEMTEFRPKPMIQVGPEPILVHIMRHYSRFGFNRFVLCMGYKSEIIRDYFLNFYTMHSDVTVDLKTNS